MSRRMPAGWGIAQTTPTFLSLAIVTLLVTVLTAPTGVALAYSGAYCVDQAPRPTTTPAPGNGADDFEGMILPNVGPQDDTSSSQAGGPVAATSPSVGGVVGGEYLPMLLCGGFALAVVGWLYNRRIRQRDTRNPALTGAASVCDDSSATD